MSLLAVLLLAVALSLDAFAVAVASGCALRPIRWEHYCRVGGAFGVGFRGLAARYRFEFGRASRFERLQTFFSQFR